MTEMVKDGLEFPDEAGYPDGMGFLSEDQTPAVTGISATEDLDRPRALLAFSVVRDDSRLSFTAIVGDEEVGTVGFERFGTRIALIHTKVEPDYRGQGIATELIWRVLDDIRSRNETISVICPSVRAFVDKYPSYATLVDSAFPGR